MSDFESKSVSQLSTVAYNYKATPWTDGGGEAINSVNLRKLENAVFELLGSGKLAPQITNKLNELISAVKADFEYTGMYLAELDDVIQSKTSIIKSDIDALDEAYKSADNIINDTLKNLEDNVNTKVDQGTIVHKLPDNSEGVTRVNTSLNIVVDAYTQEQTDAKISKVTTKIENVQTALNNYSTKTDAKIKDIEEKIDSNTSSNSTSAPGFYTASHSYSSSSSKHTFTINEILSDLPDTNYWLVPLVTLFNASYKTTDSIEIIASYKDSSETSVSITAAGDSFSVTSMDGLSAVDNAFVSGTANMIIAKITKSGSSYTSRLFINSAVSTWAE